MSAAPVPPHAAIPQAAHPPRTRRRGRTGSSAARPPVHEHVLSVLSHDALQDYSNHRIRRVEIATGATTTLAGSGTGAFLDGAGVNAWFTGPVGIAIDPSGKLFRQRDN